MIVALLLGCGGGSGILLIVRGIRARPIPLAAVLGRLDRPRPGGASVASGRRSRSWWDDLVATRVAVTTESQRRDLAVTRRPPERHVVDKILGALSFAGLAAVTGVVFPSVGIPIGPGLLAVAVLAGCVGGYFLPEALLKRQAAVCREQFRHALSSYLDLVNVLLAGGAGIESALEAAADAGDGWVFETIRDTLVRSRLTRRSPWAVFADVGQQFGIDEVIELASSLQLAGEHGARVRSSLAARAASLRGHQLARVEAEAQSASERMGIPTVVMFIAFLVLLAYPAVVQLGNS